MALESSSARQEESVEIDGDRIHLRPYRMSDLEMFTRWVQDVDVVRHTLQETKTLEQEREWLEGILQSKNDLGFVIEVKETGKPIGNCALRLTNNRGEEGVGFGIMLGEKEEWGKGYGTDATKLLVEYARDTLKAKRIWLTVDTTNERGVRAYEKAGFAIASKESAPERIHSNGEQYVMEICFDENA